MHRALVERPGHGGPGCPQPRGRAVLARHDGRAGLGATFWSDQYNVKIKSAGFLWAADRWTIVSEDPEKPSLLVEGHRGEELVGAVAFNMNRSIINYHRSLAVPDPA